MSFSRSGHFTVGVSLVIAVSGCAEASFPDDKLDVGTMGEVIGAGGDAVDLTVDPRPAPVSCGATRLDADVGHSLAVTSSPAGTTMFGIADGTIVARALERGEPSPISAKLRANVTTVTATFAGAQLVVASTTDDGAVFVDLVDPALDKYVELAKLDGAMARTPIVGGEQGSWLVPTIDDVGLTLAGFDRAFTPTDLKVWETAKPARFVAASNYSSGGAVVGWSTVDTCHLAHASNAYTTTSSALPHACHDLQLAADRSTGGAMVVFETAEGVMVSAAPHHALQPARMLRHDATEPRIAFDGRTYWVSFLDMRGQVIVGYHDDGAWTTAALPGLRPAHDAFDLAIVEGAPYLIAGDANGITSHRICTQ